MKRRGMREILAFRLGQPDGGVYGHVLAMGAILLAVTILHLYTDPSLLALHMLYRRLYYVPILYAAFVFGLRGGLATGLASAALMAPTLFTSGSSMGLADAVNEMAMYVIIGGLFGWMREVENSQNADLRQVSRQLEEAYARLEERTVEVLTIQEYTDAIMHSITAGVITVGPDGSTTTANTAAERLLGLVERDIVPHTLPALLTDEGGLRREIERVLSGRVPRTRRELTIKTRDGRAIHTQAAVARMQDLNGRLLGAVVTLEDVSELKVLADQFVRADRLAALGELTAGVAHEVRNPLGIIRATVQLLVEQHYDVSRAKEAGTIITQEVDRLDRVIKALLDFGRPWSPMLVRVNMNDLIEEVILFTKKWAGSSSVEIEEEYENDLPDISADPHQLKQVFVNLISNAVRAMEDGGGTLRISTFADADYVSVRFADDGPGMDTETANKVFDPFFSTREEGTGLGLTIVHRIVDEHDGYIDLTSAPGKGTVFTLHLPVRDALGRGLAGRASDEPCDDLVEEPGDSA